ncbi:MAG: sigma-70 family RNA polymerase sigma factor [Bacteroidales bacterium]|nr:sigma-70 family RNA polymerase sigma factor [Bacteroidales bacterium]
MTKEEFKVLFDSYFDAVRSYLFYRGAEKEQASDLAQDVFLRVWEKQLDVDPKTALRLLYKIAGDMFVSRYRRETLEMKYRKSLKNDTDDFSPEDRLRYNELHARYTKALAALSEKQRTVFLMARMEGLKYHEIAERLNLSVKAVEKRMSIALAFLKKALD